MALGKPRRELGGADGSGDSFMNFQFFALVRLLMQTAIDCQIVSKLLINFPIESFE
jgi:hypothetical protein